MHFHVLPPQELDAQLQAVWRAIQRSDPALRSPYYHPEFTRRVAASGGNARVLVMEGEGGRVEGFFPFAPLGGARLGPVGGGLADYHGGIVRQGLELDASRWLRAAGGSWFHFDHAPLTQTGLRSHVALEHVSPVCDLSGGWNAYVARLAHRSPGKGSGWLHQAEKSERRLARDLGPIRFERHATERDAVWQKLREWKTAQRVRTGTLHDDPFVHPWVRQLFDDCLRNGQPDFQGVLCALYAGDRLVSCHYGLQTHDTLHMWFASFDTELSYYQPSMVMFRHLMQDVVQDGVTWVDYGRGGYGYKLRLCTDLVPLGEGVVSLPAWRGRLWSGAKRAKRALKQDPLVARWLDKRKAAQAAARAGHQADAQAVQPLQGSNGLHPHRDRV